MACSCHGKRGLIINRMVPPDDQCTMCATKHLNMALTAWGEFTYENDNRLWVAGHVRLAMEHLKFDHREAALALRDIATTIENNADVSRNQIHDALKAARNTVQGFMLTDHADIASRFDSLKALPIVAHENALNTVDLADYEFYTWNHLGDRVALMGALHNLKLQYPDMKFTVPYLDTGLAMGNPDVVRGGKAPNCRRMRIVSVPEYGEGQVAAWGNLVECLTKDLSRKLKLPIPVRTHTPFLPVFKMPDTPSEPYVVLSASWYTGCAAKSWPYWTELAQRLLDAGLKVICVAQDTSGTITAKMPEGAVQLRGKTNEMELFALVQGASCVVTMPSSMGHVAAAYGVKSVIITGSREPARFFAYRNARHIMNYGKRCQYGGSLGCMCNDVREEVEGRIPCNYFTDVKGWGKVPDCMYDIPVDVVLAAVLGDELPDGWISTDDGYGGDRIEPVKDAEIYKLESEHANKPEPEHKAPQIITRNPAETVDLIIPLGNGSCSNNDELRIMLRSVERNLSGVGRIILATQHCPAWLNRDNVEVLDVPDKGYKDSILINKVVAAIDTYGITGKIVFAADDNVILQPMHAPDIPNMADHMELHKCVTCSKVWPQRVGRTLRYFRDKGETWPYDRSFETHTPQVFDAAKLRPLLDTVNYKAGQYTITTLFRGLLGDTEDYIPTSKYKYTLYNPKDVHNLAPDFTDRLFMGYNDSAFTSGLRERLFELFPDVSKYELYDRSPEDALIKRENDIKPEPTGQMPRTLPESMIPPGMDMNKYQEIRAYN